MHLQELAYQFVKLGIQNFLKHVESVLNVFGHRAKADFDDLRNSLDSPIEAVYSLAWYTEAIRGSAEKPFTYHYKDIKKLKKQLNWANDCEAKTTHLIANHQEAIRNRHVEIEQLETAIQPSTGEVLGQHLEAEHKQDHGHSNVERIVGELATKLLNNNDLWTLEEVVM
jgi:hypothetical protein